MSSQDNSPDSDLDVAINYLATRSTTPTPKDTNSTNNTNYTNTDFNSVSSSENQPRSENPKTVRWAEPIESEIPNTPSHDSAPKSA
ncbi:hypothetical protein F4813DRAFT_353235 [Daldinia decipiens]|uniref:uncharacterized protein n=1 Tax=Daldinia decipiens TaxID=326647 RepID=UPI0020C436BB|nr:uncharacterized protein F4813DRAFT_353235 [Daldinia decipiens]KAI1659534.1 hypothetical protein F4813DRAFT_353235 [Daldinia decipiens]